MAYYSAFEDGTFDLDFATETFSDVRDDSRSPKFSSNYSSTNPSSGLRTPTGPTSSGGGLGQNDSISSISSVKTVYPPGAYVEDEQESVVTDPVERSRSPMKFISEMLSALPPLFSHSVADRSPAGKRQACSNFTCTCKNCGNYQRQRARKTYEEALPKAYRGSVDPPSRHRDRARKFNRDNTEHRKHARYSSSGASRSPGFTFSSASSSSGAQADSAGENNGPKCHDFKYSRREKRPYFNTHTSKYDNFPETPGRKPRPYSYTPSSSGTSKPTGSSKPRPPSASSSCPRSSESTKSKGPRFFKPGDEIPSEYSKFTSSSSTTGSSPGTRYANASTGSRFNGFDYTGSASGSRPFSSPPKFGSFGKKPESGKQKTDSYANKGKRFNPYASSGRPPYTFKPKATPPSDSYRSTSSGSSNQEQYSARPGRSSAYDSKPPPQTPQPRSPAPEESKKEKDTFTQIFDVHEAKWKVLMTPNNQVTISSSDQLPWPMFKTPSCPEDVTEAAVINFVFDEKYPPLVAALSSIPDPYSAEGKVKVVKKVIRGELLRFHEGDKFPTYVLSRFDGRFPSEKEKAKEIDGRCVVC